MDVFTSFLNSEFFAAILGAVVGGCIAWLIQNNSLQRAKSEREADAKQRRTLVSKAVLFKSVRIHSDIAALSKHIEDAFAEGGADMEPWAMVRGLSHVLDPVRFTSDELALVSELGDDALLLDILELDWRHQSAMASMADYSQTRKELEALLDGEIEGEVFRAQVRPENAGRAKLLMAGLNSSALSMRSHNKADTE